MGGELESKGGGARVVDRGRTLCRLWVTLSSKLPGPLGAARFKLSVDKRPTIRSRYVPSPDIRCGAVEVDLEPHVAGRNSIIHPDQPGGPPGRANEEYQQAERLVGHVGVHRYEIPEEDSFPTLGFRRRRATGREKGEGSAEGPQSEPRWLKSGHGGRTCRRGSPHPFPSRYRGRLPGRSERHRRCASSPTVGCLPRRPRWYG